MPQDALEIDEPTYDFMVELVTRMTNVAVVYWNRSRLATDSSVRDAYTKKYLEWSHYRDIVSDALELFHLPEDPSNGKGGNSDSDSD